MRKHNRRSNRNMRQGERASLRRKRLFLQQDPGPASERAQAKALAREKALDQIALDKLNGLENGQACRDAYRAAMKKAAAAWANRREGRAALRKRKRAMRAADSYRAARENEGRGARAKWLKAKRLEAGLARPQMDDMLRKDAEHGAKFHWVNNPSPTPRTGKDHNKAQEMARRARARRAA